MLTTGKTILDVANEHSFAVPAFNISDWAMFRGIVEISEEKNAPLIVGIHPDEVRHIGREMITGIIERAHSSTVPIAIHWDHGATYEQMLQAFQYGFTSVMIDGSLKPFDENLAITKKVTDSAHVLGVSVEGELGTIGGNDSYAEAGAAEIIYTDPDDAVTFVKTTGVDSLAIAIGTFHGFYPAHLKPELKLDLLKEIKSRVGIPLVLHGGSGNPDDEIREAARIGINKINISTDIKVAYHDKMREVLGSDSKVREPNAIQPACLDAMKEVAAHKIDLFGATGKGSLY
ncbi:ketose-bisphosphate aldolase [Micromonospora carbonacea]|uniref:Ketose-bisphosphate aldolase n=1 Tax=Micromonospora carbonacea TaxID=47853 RepID=A0A7H8XHJ4_9ACTN|nr:MULTISPECIES: ketose-bisphosphate aldolase [Micromonospora]MBB5827770.1 fructose-bisphosphate aldolase class II [Micromonospora carbonacea]MDG4818323.1 ketose-bisphosphate aldolase [Micromonospora sp. WMMD956]QLD24513.1 ketose-bisphosphate aldolase [Micromonospora carbonacea]